MAGNDKNKGSEKDPQSLVGDLLRRATSPEVLAGVAGAAAAARFTKHVVEDSDEAEGDEPPEQEEASGAEASREEEPDIQGDEVDEDTPEEPRAEEDEPDEDEPEEPRAEEDEPDQDEPAEPEAAAEPEADAEAEPSPDEDGEDEGEGEEMPDSSASNGSLGSDDERMELLDQARRFAEQLTGHPVESFSSLEQDDRGWRIGVEVVELSRVPSTTDVLGSYELVLTSEGEFVDFRRAHRYYRNSTDDQSS